MVGIDRFLSEALTKKIKENLDKNELRKIERELFLTYGMSIKISMEHYNKFHLLLNQIKTDPESFGLKCLDEICQIQHSKDKIIIRIKDDSLIKEILQFFGDGEIRKILSVIMKEELTIPDILKQSRIPRTSAYRIIENLIIRGVIVEVGKVLSKSKKILKYKCIFDEIDFQLSVNSFFIKVQISEKDFEKSTIMEKLYKC